MPFCLHISFACGAETGSELALTHFPQPTIPMQKPYLLIVHCVFSHLHVMASLRSLCPSTHTASFHHPSLHLFTYTAVCQASLSYLVALVTAHCQGCRDLCGPLLGKCFAPIPTCRPASMGVLKFFLKHRREKSHKITVKWSDLGIGEGTSATVTDVWNGTPEGNATGQYSTNVPSHGTMVVKIEA